jgi:type IV secretion system protein VirD4
VLSYAGEIGEKALEAIARYGLQYGGKGAQIAAGLLKPKTDDELLALLNSMEAKNPKAHDSLTSYEPHGVFFGKQYGKYVVKPEETDGHVLVIGGPGTGKSTCIAIPTLRHWKGAVFAIDIKGELYAQTRQHRPNIKVFAPQDEESLFGYDPYFFLKISDNPAQEARAIAQSIIPLPANIKDTFWIESAQTLLTGAILHYHECGYTFSGTLKEILDEKARDLLEIIAEKSPSDKAKRCVRNYVGMDDKTFMSIFPHLGNAVEAIVNNDTLAAALSKEETISPEDLEKGQDVYIQIPEHLLSQWKSLVTLIVNQYITFFEKRKEEDKNNPQSGKNRPILMLLDEFPRIGKIPKIIDGLSTLRSKKITICLVVQSLAQLEMIYGRTTRKVIADTCAFKAVLGATDAETQKYFSQLVGTYEKLKNQKSKNFDPVFNVQAGSGVQTSFEDGKPLIKPEEFATLQDIVLLYPLPFNFCRVQKQPYYIKKVTKP